MKSNGGYYGTKINDNWATNKNRVKNINDVSYTVINNRHSEAIHVMCI